MTLEEMVAAVQKVLRVQIDGKAGPETWSAIYKAIVAPTLAGTPEPPEITDADPRSEKNILTLQQEVRPLARALVHKAALAGMRIKIISGLRTYKEQDALYAQGRTAPGKIVTKAKGGTRTIILASPSTLEYSKATSILKNHPSTRPWACSVWISVWIGAGTGKRLLTSLIFNFAPHGQMV